MRSQQQTNKRSVAFLLKLTYYINREKKIALNKKIEIQCLVCRWLAGWLFLFLIESALRRGMHFPFHKHLSRLGR